MHCLSGRLANCTTCRCISSVRRFNGCVSFRGKGAQSESQPITFENMSAEEGLNIVPPPPDRRKTRQPLSITEAFCAPNYARTFATPSLQQLIHGYHNHLSAPVPGALCFIIAASRFLASSSSSASNLIGVDLVYDFSLLKIRFSFVVAFRSLLAATRARNLASTD